MVYSTTNDGSLMYCPRFWAGGLAVEQWRPLRALRGARWVTSPCPPSGEVRGEVPPLVGGGLWYLSSSGARPYRGRRASPCPSNGGVMGVTLGVGDIIW